MDGTEHDLKRTGVENATDDPVTKRNRSQAVSMPKTEFHSGYLHFRWLIKTLHA